jgi:hypothetical protein
VHQGHVAFNTESCELEVLTVEGKPVWKKWLGDPLMSMPAMAGERIFQVYPDSRGDRRHYLAAFDLTEGRPLWKQPLPGEIITAPVLAEGHCAEACWPKRPETVPSGSAPGRTVPSWRLR